MKNLRKVSKIQVLTISALIVVLILLFPIPMSRSREELYEITETYYDEVPQIVNETVSVPYSVSRFMQWQITWFLLTLDKQFGPSVGTDIWSASFNPNWGLGAIYGSYDDGIGFAATASFYLETSGLYRFTLGSDDGSKLYIDGGVVIDLWSEHFYRETTSALVWIEKGWHTLGILYYDWLGSASIYFNVDKSDLFTWEETQYFTIQIPRIQIQQVPKQRSTIASRTVTETVYLSILEYLMKGRKV